MPCQAHLGEVRSAQAEFRQRGVAVLVVSFAEPAQLAHYQQEHRWPFTILADPKRAAYRAFALKRLSWFDVYSFATLKAYVKLLRAGMKRTHYRAEDIYQSGGDFLVDCAGNIISAYRSQHPNDRPPPAKLLEVIDRHLIFRGEAATEKKSSTK
ncbi:MAG TPA: AhpC/TSA family protein [Candidatus Binatia bacterium]|nr:AhpC/TSA family protein [Candidatus Binatia bacterium]